MKYTKILLFLLLITTINANVTITKQWLKKQPKSYAKDFYIWRYLDQNITPKDAQFALDQAKRVNSKIYRRYAKKIKNKKITRKVECEKMNSHKLIKQEQSCILSGLTFLKITQLSKKEIRRVMKKIDKKNYQILTQLKLAKSKKPFLRLIRTNADIFFDTFNKSGKTYREKYFNHKIPPYTKNRLKNDKRFNRTIKLIVTNKNLYNIQKCLLDLKTKDLSSDSLFFLAMNAILHKNKIIALRYLKVAYEKEYFKSNLDKILFWQYKLTNKKAYLNLLVQSWDINMYSLLAKEIKHIKPNNIFYNPIAYKNLKKETNYNINDPFEWLKVLDDYKTLDEKKYKYYKRRFNTIETQGHMAIIQAKYDKFKKSYFPLPYQKYLKKLPKKRQALIYALGRQESRFVPTSISPSYANGVMQIMPFLSKALAKQLKDKYDIDKQLTAKTNLRYADFHLNYLTSRLDNVLFVAYAYNGGIGFTTRMLKNSGLFKTKRQYEPFLSMELVHYDESREYGKKVLTNYYVYNNYLRKDIKFSSLFENLRSPY